MTRMTTLTLALALTACSFDDPDPAIEISEDGIRAELQDDIDSLDEAIAEANEDLTALEAYISTLK